MSQVTTLQDFLDQARPIITGWITEGVTGIGASSGGGGGGGITVHALDGAYHSGTLADSQAPQFLKTDGTRALTGNLSVNAGVTIDGVDISDFYTDYGNHITNTNIHVDHTAVILTAGDGMTGGGDISASRTFNVVAGDGLTTAADSIYLTTPGTLAYNSSNSAAGSHTHAITNSSNPGVQAIILSTNTSGYLQLLRLGLNVSPGYPLHIRRTTTIARLEYDATNYTDFAVSNAGGFYASVYGGDFVVMDANSTQMNLDVISTAGDASLYLISADTYNSSIIFKEGTAEKYQIQKDSADDLVFYSSSDSDTFIQYDHSETDLLLTPTNDIYMNPGAHHVWVISDTYAYLQVRSETTHAYVSIDASHTSGTGVPVLRFMQNNTTPWSVMSDATRTFIISDNGSYQNCLTFAAGGDGYLAPYDDLFIHPEVGDIYLKAAGGEIRVEASSSLETDNFASMTTGWQISYAGNADFRNIYADELRVLAFTADIYQSIIGSIIVTPGRGRLSRDFQIPATSNQSYIYFEDMEEEAWYGYQLFTSGDTIRLRYIDTSGGGLIVADIWGTVTSYSDQGGGEQSWLFTCTDDGGVSGSYIYAGSLALDYGTSGDGTWLATVTDTAGSPYSQVATWTTNPWTPGNWTVHTRIGNLDGIGSLGAEYGIWAGQGTTVNDSQIIMSDSTAEIRNLDLYITASTVNKVIASTSGFISAGATAPTDYSTAGQEGFWAGDDSGTPKMWVGDRDGESIIWDGSAFYIKADTYNYIRTNGQDMEFYAGASSSTRTIWVDGSTGDAYFGDTSGSNIWLDAGTGVMLRQGTTSYIQLLTNGDAYFGTGASKANIFWDQSSGILYFRSGTNNRAYVDANGFIWAASGTAYLADTGIEVVANSTGFNQWNSYSFVNASGQYIGGLYCFGTTSSSNIELESFPLGTGNARISLWAEANGAGGSGNIELVFGNYGSSGVLDLYFSPSGTASSYAYLYGNVIFKVDDDFMAAGGITVGQDNSAYRATNGHIWIYNGTTRMGEFGYSDTTWFRINQNTAKNIYTPRYMAVGGGLTVGGSSFGDAGDIYATNDILAGGGLCAGASTTSNPATGDVLYTGQLTSYKNATSYTVYGITWLTTIVGIYGGTSRTSANNGNITTGVPANATAVYITGVAQATAAGAYIWMGHPTGTSNVQEIHFPVANRLINMAGWVPCDSSGQIKMTYSTGVTFTLYMRYAAYTI